MATTRGKDGVIIQLDDEPAPYLVDLNGLSHEEPRNVVEYTVEDDAAEQHLDEQIDPPPVSDEFDPIHGNELGMKLEDEVEPGANHMTVELAGEVFNLVDERIVEGIGSVGVDPLNDIRGMSDPTAAEDAFDNSRADEYSEYSADSGEPTGVLVSDLPDEVTEGLDEIQLIELQEELDYATGTDGE